MAEIPFFEILFPYDHNSFFFQNKNFKFHLISVGGWGGGGVLVGQIPGVKLSQLK